MGTHDRVWSRHTHTTKGNSFPCDLVWIIPHFLTVFTFPAHLPLQPELEALCWARCPPPLMKPYPAYPSCCWGMVTLRLAPAPLLLGSWSASPPVTHSIISFTTLLERSAAVSPLHHHTALYNTVSLGEYIHNYWTESIAWRHMAGKLIVHSSLKLIPVKTIRLSRGDMLTKATVSFVFVCKLNTLRLLWQIFHIGTGPHANAIIHCLRRRYPMHHLSQDLPSSLHKNMIFFW